MVLIVLSNPNTFSEEKIIYILICKCSLQNIMISNEIRTDMLLVFLSTVLEIENKTNYVNVYYLIAVYSVGEEH